MAIQLAGNTVIHDNQNVQVSGVTTASSFVGDGSQLTNLPASGGTLEATASGTLADGSKVIVNTDGTVSVVAQSETTQGGGGDKTVFNFARTYTRSVAYDPINQKVVIAYRDQGNSQYGTAVVGEVNPGTNAITFGSEFPFGSSNGSYDVGIVYDSSNQKVVIAYRDGNGNAGKAVVGTVSGTNISFGSIATFENGNGSYGANDVGITFDSTNNRIVIAYKDNPNSDRGTAVVGQVTGTNISFGSKSTFESDTTYNPNLTFDSTNGKVVIIYNDGGNSNKGTAVVGEVNPGTNAITFGTPVPFASTASSWISAITYDPSKSRVVAIYRDAGNSNYPTAVVGEVSGNSINFGTPVAFNSATISYASTTYDSSNNEVVIVYQDNGNSGYGTVIKGTVDPSNNSISFGSSVVFNSANTAFTLVGFDSTNNKLVFAYQDKGNSDYGTSSVFVESGFPLAEVGSAEVFESANADYISATYDSTNNKVVIAYRDVGNSWPNLYGTAIVGTVSGTSITFGTPVVFHSSLIQYTSVVHDTANDKIVIAFSDGGESWYGKAVVGEVNPSTNAITFGSPSTFKFGNSGFISAAFDSSTGKVVVAFQDGQYSDRGTAQVGTVSGTSISFGGQTIFENSAVSYISAVSTNNKVVVAYCDDTNSYYGTAAVGTVSGTTINFGTPVPFEYAYSDSISTTFDSTNNKVVIGYRDVGNSDYGTAVVGTVSGTSISFGTPVVFNTARSDPMSLTYDPTNQKVVIAYLHGGNSQGKAIGGTVSGTSISFDTSSTFESGEARDISAIYDPDTKKVVIAYRDGGNSNYGTAVTFNLRTFLKNLTSENFIGISDGAYSNGQTATIQISGSIDDAQSSLTPGQKYYVQNDGTLSETADSPSVFAGTAVASTKLIING